MKRLIRSTREPSSVEYGKAISEGQKRLQDRYEPFKITNTYFCNSTTNSTGYRITLEDEDIEYIADNGGDNKSSSFFEYKLYGPFASGQIKSWSELFKFKSIDSFKTLDQIMTWIFHNIDYDD